MHEIGPLDRNSPSLGALSTSSSSQASSPSPRKQDYLLDTALVGFESPADASSEDGIDFVTVAKPTQAMVS